MEIKMLNEKISELLLQNSELNNSNSELKKLEASKVK